MVVAPGFDLVEEVPGRPDIRDHRFPETTDLRLHRVPAVEEDDVVTALLDEFVHSRRAHVRTTALNSIRGHDDVVRRPEGDELVSHFDTQAREVVPGAIRPFDVRITEGRVRLRDLRVLLEVPDVPAQGRVDPLTRSRALSASSSLRAPTATVGRPPDPRAV